MRVQVFRSLEVAGLDHTGARRQAGAASGGPPVGVGLPARRFCLTGSGEWM